MFGNYWTMLSLFIWKTKKINIVTTEKLFQFHNNNNRWLIVDKHVIFSDRDDKYTTSSNVWTWTFRLSKVSMCFLIF